MDNRQGYSPEEVKSCRFWPPVAFFGMIIPNFKEMLKLFLGTLHLK